MAIDAGPAAPRRRGNILLIVSLCLNVAFVAMIAIGVITAANRNRQRPVPGGPLAPQALMTEVSDPQERARLQAVIDRHAGRLKELRIESAQARLAAFRTFAEPGFSSQEFAQSLERVRAADTVLQDEMAKMTAESVAVLSPADRKAIADKIRQRTRPPWRRFLSRQ